MAARLDPAVSTGLRLALAHHPLCEPFRAHRFHAGGLGVCAGCAAALPGFLAGFVGGVALLVAGAVASPPMAGVGLALGLPHLWTYVRRGSRVARAVAKGLGGLGLGALSAAVLAQGGTVLVAYLAATAFVFPLLQFARWRRMKRTCVACPWRADWERCPGFRLTA